RYAEQRIFERYGSAPVLLRRWMLEPLLEAAPPALAPRLMRRARNYVAQAKTPLPDRLETWNFLPRLGFGTILDPEFAAAVDCAAPFEHMRAVYASAPRTALVNRMLYYDWRFTLADNDLRKVTTMCELAGVRVSYPMLHPDVVDVSIQVPAEHKMRGTELRTFYRRAMAGFLPQQIIDKTKHGFGLPFGLWLERSADLAELVRGNLTDLRRRGLIRPEFLDELCRRHGAEDARYYGVFIWTLAMLEQWFKEHRLSP
ncbi:MAG: asparagine synthase-related protein, partial [Steroidobacteraceae bacterium]